MQTSALSIPHGPAIAAIAIDPEVLDLEPMLRNFGALGPTVNTLFTLFLRDAEQHHHALRAALSAGDLTGARMAAHAAAGAARTAGARRLGALCCHIEDALVHGDALTAALAVQDLAPALDDVRTVIARI